MTRALTTLFATPLLALALALVLSLAPSCAAAAGAVGGYVLAREVLDDEAVAHVTYDVERVWKESQSVLRKWADRDVETVAFPREASAQIEGRDVKVSVEAHDLDHTIVKVRAERSKLYDSAMSERVLKMILDELEPSDHAVRAERPSGA